MYDKAREFLARLPFPADDEPGYINLHWRDKGGKRWFGRACRNVDEFINHLTYWNQQPRDFYVCMSRQSEMEEVISKKGYPYISAVRKTENATCFSGLWLDLDFKNYSTPDEAAKAFGEFIKQTKLPAPTMYVNSGGGLHIHWILSAPTSMDDWRPLAHALAEACKRCSLRADTACTVDGVRILRIPDTLNYKYDPPKPVKLLHNGNVYNYDVLDKILTPYKVTLKSNNPIVNPLAAGISSRPVDIRGLISECAFIEDALKTNGANHAQPLWHVTGLLSTFLVDGRNVYHELSKGHSTYTPDATDIMYDRKEKEKAAKNLGWPLCNTIHTAGSKHCATCVHFPAGKSPLNFAQPVVTLTSTSNILPPGYRHNSKFHVEQILTDTNGVISYYEVSSWPMYDAWVELNDDSQLHFTSVLQNKPVLINLAIGNVEGREMRRDLQKKGFEIFTKQVKALGEFLMAWIKELKAQNQYKGNTRSLGWDEDNLTFAYGGSIWGANGGISTTACPDMNYIPKGKLDPWKDAAKLVTDQQCPELDAILASSFGAPLTTFTGHACWMFSAYSVESGAGKTTAMKTAQAVWGNPSKAMQSLGDTQNAVTHKLGRTANLPIFWDEMKMGSNASVKNVSFFLGLSGGREKDRLDANAEAKEIHTWKTILVGASNASMIGYVTSQSKVTDAELRRIIELKVPPRTQGEVSPTDASQIIGDLDANYGEAGKIFAEYIGANTASIKKDIIARSKELEAEINITSSERFWQANYVCLTVGAEYSNSLGLTDINIQALKECLKNNIIAMRGSVQEIKKFEINSADVAELLWEVISSIQNKNRLVTDIIWRQPGRVPAGKVNLLGPPNQIFNADWPFVQIGVNDRCIRVAEDQFVGWLSTNQKSPYKETFPIVMVKLKQNPGVTSLKATIGAGAGTHSTPDIKVLDFDVSQIPELQRVIDNSISASQTAGSTNVVPFPAKTIP